MGRGDGGRKGFKPEEREELDKALESFRRNRPEAANPPPDTSEDEGSSSDSSSGASDDSRDKGKENAHSSESDSEGDVDSTKFNIPSPVLCSDDEEEMEPEESLPSTSTGKRGPGRPSGKAKDKPPKRSKPGRPPTTAASKAKSKIDWEDVTHLVPRDPPLPLGAPAVLPLAGPCRIRKPAAEDCTEGQEVNEISVSVTISAGRRDIEKEVVKPRLSFFLRRRCTAGLVGFERGFHEDHLHCQAVMTMRVVSEPESLMHAEHVCVIRSPHGPSPQDSNTERGACNIINVEIKECLGWVKTDTRPSGAKIKVTCLKESELHTFDGMVGYCTKDKHKAHYDEISHNITDDQRRRGDELYIAHGAGTFNFVHARTGPDSCMRVPAHKLSSACLPVPDCACKSTQVT